MNVWLLSIEALDPAGNAVTLRYATEEYFDPAGYAWRPRIQQAGLYTAGLYAGDLLNVSRSGFGETTLVNADGALDGLVDYAMDGRRVCLQLATETGVIDVLVGTLSRVTFQRRIVSLRLRDPVETLQQPHPLTRYAGDNVLPDGLEGTDDDIGGNVKPRLYGQVRNAQPVLVNSSKLIYQISDSDCTVGAVYDNGAPLTLDGDYSSVEQLLGDAPATGEWSDWEPPEGTYRRYRGYIRLGDSPTGTITCDADAPKTQAGDVMASILDEIGAAYASADVSALNAVGDLRLWISDTTTTAELLDQIAVSTGGYWRIDTQGQIRMGALPAPSEPVTTLRDHQIIEIDRESAGAGSNGLPVWSVTMTADPIETTQTDVAGVVSTARRARLAKATREVNRESQATLTRHPLAEAISIESRLATTAQAGAVADRVLALLSPRRDSVTLTARAADVAGITIASSIRIVTPRLGYAEGRTLLVVGRTLDAGRNRIQLTLWG